MLDLYEIATSTPSSWTWTVTALPCGTWTRRRRGSPSRWTTVGGSVRRHGAVRTRSSAVAVAASSVTSSPIASSTARSALPGTRRCSPRQSHQRVSTPFAAANSSSSPRGSSGACVSSLTWPAFSSGATRVHRGG
nr:hypothetical protein [Janibacter hoylei]